MVAVGVVSTGKQTIWNKLTPWLVLVCGLAATAVATAFVAWTAHEQSQTRFTSAVEDTELAVRNRIAIYLAVLRGATAAVAQNETMTRLEFRSYIRRLGLTNYPGAQGIGFSRRIAAHEKEAIVAAARADGITDFHLWPPTNGECHAILYLEPLDARNRAALGYDMWSDPTRHAAMAKACDTAALASSARVTLVQEIKGQEQAGFLVYAPVYRAGMPITTTPQRREALLGFVYAPFRSDDLFRGILGQATVPAVEFDAYAGVPVETNLMHRSSTLAHRKDLQRVVSGVDIAGRPWTLVFHPTRQFESKALKTLTPLTALLGLLVTVLLCGATLAQRRALEALREAEQQLRQHAAGLEQRVAERTRSLQETVQSLESFSYSIAHDLRAPLRSIHSFGSLLLDEHAAHLDDAGKDYLRRMTTAARRMDDLIRDLLAYNNLSRHNLPVTPVLLDRTAAAALQDLHDDISASGGTVTVAPALPRVAGNETLLQQVFTNLVSNALKFVAPSVKPDVKITAERRGQMVRVAVADNGIGIDPAHQHRIFGVFERLHGVRKYPGTGIGLAIVHKAIERMGGTVGVQSTPGRGSTFWFELKAADA